MPAALLGRLRDDLATPLPPNSTLPASRTQHGVGVLQQPTLKKKKSTSGVGVASADSGGGSGSGSRTGTPTNIESDNKATTIIQSQAALADIEAKQKRILALDTHPEYRKEHETNATLLALWKKVSMFCRIVCIE